MSNSRKAVVESELPAFVLQLAALAKEINARQSYRRCQREKQEELMKELDFLFLVILDAARDGKMKKVAFDFASHSEILKLSFGTLAGLCAWIPPVVRVVSACCYFPVSD